MKDNCHDNENVNVYPGFENLLINPPMTTVGSDYLPVLPQSDPGRAIDIASVAETNPAALP
jgi:hypothetical protein